MIEQDPNAFSPAHLRKIALSRWANEGGASPLRHTAHESKEQDVGDAAELAVPVGPEVIPSEAAKPIR
ncbi:hypothetical protein [Acidovorax sp. A1169]|uniref:hypothetical protein n=1 Tax=Acidovorax sp. A1169 TaxID=3059524 RepID=UPI0027379505|nr:hypothetical protein [Acidovorax sp. A1169]MDP4076378.1 hypothetical protein [Acidovorax sp. A1169]